MDNTKNYHKIFTFSLPISDYARSKIFWKVMTLGITGYLDFVYRPMF
jgi:hypothetical protein